MRRIPLKNIPAECEIVGDLYTSDDPRELSIDMLEIMLPSNILICAGWHPDSDPEGEYAITASIGCSNLYVYTTKDAYEAGRMVEDLVNKLLPSVSAG